MPHLESVFTGPLPAGTYTITIGGSAGCLTGYFASQTRLHGNGQWGHGMRSVNPANVQWSPFSDSLLTVHVFNSTSTLLITQLHFT
ncbi:MAG: hypothetical protein IPL86_17520 [Flavobacteriales bacterium]|nr:hypothetical protein [Flavobacteriales bacterium]